MGGLLFLGAGGGLENVRLVSLDSQSLETDFETWRQATLGDQPVRIAFGISTGIMIAQSQEGKSDYAVALKGLLEGIRIQPVDIGM